MDGRTFDRFTKNVGGGLGSRRTALKLLGSGAICAALGRLGLEETAAGRRCLSRGRWCDGNRECCSRRCCPPLPSHAFRTNRCAPDGHRCCPAEAGGGSCPADTV